MRPTEDMHQLMRRIKEYKRLEDDRLQGMAKPQPLHNITKIIILKDFRRKLGMSQESRVKG